MLLLTQFVLSASLAVFILLVFHIPTDALHHRFHESDALYQIVRNVNSEIDNKMLFARGFVQFGGLGSWQAWAAGGQEVYDGSYSVS